MSCMYHLIKAKSTLLSDKHLCMGSPPYAVVNTMSECALRLLWSSRSTGVGVDSNITASFVGRRSFQSEGSYSPLKTETAA